MTHAAPHVDPTRQIRDLIRPGDYWRVTFIMGLLGAFLWAIRGTAGFGGPSGGLLAGLGWGVLWLAFSHFGPSAPWRPLATPWIVAAITFGITLGGTTGYGVYVGWVQGKFYLDYPEGLRQVAAWTGYLMLFVCGLHWGGVTGAFMAWCLPSAAVRWPLWLVRVGLGLGGGWAALRLVDAYPHLVLPYWDEGLYAVKENATCQRALASIRNIAPHVGLYLGFLIFEIARRDAKAVAMMTVMGLGFAVPFSVGGYWHTFHDSAWPLGWWKFWELSIGLGGGLAFGLAFFLFNRPQLDGEPQCYSAKSYVLGACFPIWLAATLSIGNGFRGFARVHGFEEAALPWQPWFALIFLAPATVLFALHITRLHHPGRLSLATFLGALAALALIAMPFHDLPIVWPLARALDEDAVLLLVPVVLAAGYALYRPSRLLDRSPLPGWLPAAVLGLIVFLGYATSIHLPLELRSAVLLAIYTLSIAISAALFAGLRAGR